jgi:predicted phosphodiesterase
LVTHGSPGSLNEYLVQETPETRFREIAQKSKADIIVTGHAHIPSIRQVDGVWFVNCGSVGRTEDGDPRACYALLSLDPFSIVHVRVSYDISRAIDALRKRHLPDSFRRIISEGKPLDVVSEPEDSL